MSKFQSTLAWILVTAASAGANPPPVSDADLPLPWKPGNVSNSYTFHAGDTATLRFNCPVDGVTKARFAIAHSGDNGYLYLTVTVKDHALVNSTLEQDPTYGPLPEQFRLAVDKTNEVLDDAYELIPTKPGDKTETKATP